MTGMRIVWRYYASACNLAEFDELEFGPYTDFHQLARGLSEVSRYDPFEVLR